MRPTRGAARKSERPASQILKSLKQYLELIFEFVMCIVPAKVGFSRLAYFDFGRICWLLPLFCCSYWSFQPGFDSSLLCDSLSRYCALCLYSVVMNAKARAPSP